MSNTISLKYLEFKQLPAARVQGLLSAFFGNFESKIHKNLPAYTKRSNGSHFVTWPRDRPIRDPIQCSRLTSYYTVAEVTILLVDALRELRCGVSRKLMFVRMAEINTKYFKCKRYSKMASRLNAIMLPICIQERQG